MQRTATLCHRGTEHDVTLQTLSRLGALIDTTLSPGVGSWLELVVELPNETVVLTCQVALRLDVTRAARLGVAPGIAVRFDASSAELADRIAADVARKGVAVQRTTKATRKLIAPILSTLLVASRTDPDTGRSIFEGRLTTTTVADLFAFLERMGKSGKLLLTRGRRTATVELVRGSITNVTSSWPVARADLLFQLLDWTDGSFALYLSPHPPSNLGRGVNITHLLLEHARQSDESAHALLASR